MADSVGVTVNSQLLKIVEDLKKIQGSAEDLQKTMTESAETVSKKVDEQTKSVQTYLEKIKGFGRRVADGLRQDFQSLLSLNALTGAMKMSEQFRGTFKESVALSDTIRKLGGHFGITQNRFKEFQKNMTKGLGDIGLSSEAAARSLSGLAETPVRGEGNLLEYAKTAGQLASIGREQGREGDVSKGLANVIRARGGNVNDTGQMKAVAEDVRRAVVATGKGPSEILSSMENLFKSMPEDMRKAVSTRGLTNLAATGAVAGPQATKFIEDFLGRSPIMRQALEAQGFKGVFNEQGLDVEKFRKASQEVLGRVGGDPRKAAQTLGLSEDTAEGFVRLVESLDQVKAAQEGIAKSTGDLNSQYRESMGLGESFRANINKVKSMIAGPLATGTQGLSSMLSKASESNMGAAAVVGGGGLLAALLAGGGLRGVGKGLGLGGLAKAQALEAVTGEKVQNVYVVNAGEIGAASAMGGGGLLGKAGSALGKAGLVGAAGAAGYGIGTAANSLIESQTQGKTSEGFEGSAVERLIFKIEKMMGTESAKKIEAGLKVQIDTGPGLKKAQSPSRGAGY